MNLLLDKRILLRPGLDEGKECEESQNIVLLCRLSIGSLNVKDLSFGSVFRYCHCLAHKNSHVFIRKDRRMLNAGGLPDINYLPVSTLPLSSYVRQ